MSSLPDCIVAIDTFQFQNFEVPTEIPWGGSQKLTSFILPGGVKILQPMGRVDKPLVWSGEFQGAQAKQRALYLDGLRVAGSTHILTWDIFRFLVVISDFDPVYKKFYRIPYTITCEIIQNLTAIPTSAPSNSVNDAINTDMANMLLLENGDGVLSGLMASLNSAISAVSSFATASSSVINSVMTPLNAVQARVGVLVASTSNTLHNIGSFGGTFPGNPLLGTISKLTTECSNAVDMSNLILLEALAARMSLNLVSLSTPTPVTTIAVGGTNLFAVAAQQYGDATQWQSIAVANNLTDPMIGTGQKIIVPVLTPGTTP